MILQGPDNITGFTYEGKSYDADEDGCIEVPTEAVAAAISHGFSVIPDEEPVEKPVKAAKKNGKKQAADEVKESVKEAQVEDGASEGGR